MRCRGGDVLRDIISFWARAAKSHWVSEDHGITILVIMSLTLNMQPHLRFFVQSPSHLQHC